MDSNLPISQMHIPSNPSGQYRCVYSSNSDFNGNAFTMFTQVQTVKLLDR